MPMVHHDQQAWLSGAFCVVVQLAWARQDLSNSSLTRAFSRRWDYFKKVVAKPDTSMTAGKFDFSGFKDGNLWVALITFL
jgi:hypothetical protein